MSTALVPVNKAHIAVATPDKLSDLQRLGGLLAASGYFQDAREMAQAAVKVMAGEEIGVKPIAAMMGVNIIKGKVSLGANLIASRIRASGYDYEVVRLDDTGCVLKFMRGEKVLGESSFVEDDARKAKLTGGNWQNYPRNMYFARAVSNGARWFTPEIFGGAAVYTPDELGAEVNAEGDVVHDEPKPKRGRKPKTTAYKTGETREEIATRRVAEIQQAADKLTADPEPSQENGNGAPAANGDVPPEVATLWGKMGDFPSSVEVFADLKKDIDEVQGSTIDYYQILHKFGMRHGNDLKGKDSEGKPRTRGHARLCARELLEHLNKCKAEPPAEGAGKYQAQPDDLPEVMGGTYREPAEGGK